MKALRQFLRRLFCRHEWDITDWSRYAITNSAGKKVGEVTLTLLNCSKCGEDRIIPSDRTSETAQEAPKTQP